MSWLHKTSGCTVADEGAALRAAVGVFLGTGARAEQQRDTSRKKPEVILLPEPGEKLKPFVFTSQNDTLLIGS